MAKVKLEGCEKFDFPSGIDFVEEPSCIRLKIKETSSNMQEDASAFESWALILRIKTNKNIKLSFDKIIIKDYFKDLSPDQQHYMRFLYRLSKFQEQMSSWFSVSDESQKELDLFKEKFNSIEKINNVPGTFSKYRRKKGVEHLLEKAFVHIKEFREANEIDFNVYDQLPNGLFFDKVKRENKIFNTGYFDLWGIDSTGSFTLFELKEPENKQLGIISELYFYSNFAFDLLNEKNNFRLNKKNSKYRNYEQFLKNQGTTETKVNSFFLVCNLHPEFEKHQKEIISLLNKNSPISYGVKKYKEYDFDKMNEKLEEIYRV